MGSVSVNVQQMENGEMRFRMLGQDGSTYIRTEASLHSGWQKSHYHRTLRELYLVSSGWILIAVLDGDSLKITRLEVGQTYLTQPGVPHNVYMSPFAVTHTVKFGNREPGDWFPSEELDKRISLLQIEGDRKESQYENQNHHNPGRRGG